MGLERRYHLDVDALDAAWRARSRLVHPDRYVGRSALERRMSLQWTALLNQARRVLRDPVSRARYLASGSDRPPDSGGPALDTAFLEQMFELRMEAEENPAAVAPRGEALRAALLAEIDGIFSAWEAGRGGLEAVEERLARLRYLDNLVAATLPAE